MMKQHTFCPYRQNIIIIKNFLAKPLTLVIAIFFAITAIFNFAVRFSPFSNSFYGGFDVISTMLSVAFFLFYFFSKNKNTDTTYSAPVNLIQAVSIINIVLAGIALVMLTILILITFVAPALLANIISSFLFLPAAVIAPVLLIQLLCYIFFLMFAGSIKKSVSSIYLRKKGAGAFGVTAIILIVFYLALAAAILIFLPELTAQYSEALQLIADFSGNAEIQSYVADQLAHLNISGSYTDIISIISLGITIISFILLAVFAFRYKSYINNYTKNINVADNEQDSKEGFTPFFTESPVFYGIACFSRNTNRKQHTVSCRRHF